MPVSRGCAQLAEEYSGRDRTPEKRKVDSSILSLTTPTVGHALMSHGVLALAQVRRAVRSRVRG
jgi:hypothetical protein